MISEERKDAVYLKAKHYFAFCGELEETVVRQCGIKLTSSGWLRTAAYV
jgi:hypothetical protein